MDAPWQVELLGWLRAAQGSRTVSRFRSHQTGALLAYLAYHQHHSHPRESLIELLWPECDPRDGRNRLSVALSSLRRQLEPPGVPAGVVILANRATVQLNPNASVTDVARFEAALQTAGRNRNTTERAERLAEAVTLYQGELLPGYCEAWVLPERQRLAEAFHQAIHQLVALLQQAGNLPDALRYARMAAGADPLREETHHDLIRLLVAGGQPEAALRQYQEWERLLARELRAAPTAETRDFAEQIRDQAGRLTTAVSPPYGRAPSLLPDGAAPRRHHPAERASLEVRLPADVHPTDLREFPPPEAAPAHSGSLPLQFTRFFGREAEIEQLCSMLLSPPASSPRLVTLTGPGGSGKTRLAVEVAQRLGEKWAGRVWFVSLVDLADPRLIADQALDSLRLPHSPDLIPLEQVVAFLSCKPALLLLDNFEHLVEGGAEMVQALLTRVPSLCVLVTSRRRLNLPGEREFPVPPLPIPGIQDEAQSSPEYLVRCPSVQLFVDRAQAMRPDFQVTRGNAGDVATLCARLEGRALAIELAAARAGMLTPAQMVPRLESTLPSGAGGPQRGPGNPPTAWVPGEATQGGGRFELLVSRTRGMDVRHQSLRRRWTGATNSSRPSCSGSSRGSLSSGGAGRCRPHRPSVWIPDGRPIRPQARLQTVPGSRTPSIYLPLL